MQQTMQHLNDEHMRLYEWSGAVAGMAGYVPQKSKRAHPWHASYAVLALLTTLLALSGCDRKGTAEAANEQVDQAIHDMKEKADSPKDNTTGEPGPADEAGGAVDDAREKSEPRTGQSGDELQKQ